MNNLIWFPLEIMFVLGCARFIYIYYEIQHSLIILSESILGLIVGVIVIDGCVADTCKFGICKDGLDALRSSWWDLGFWLFHISSEYSGHWWIIIFWAIFGILILILLASMLFLIIIFFETINKY
jgi:hypothetical protein